MNDYRITYSADHEEMESIITERTERAARDSFKKAHKAENCEIFNVELIRENTCATKRQERDTLEAIKTMVMELGPKSYLATAFEGCFEDAESNIENDFADSMKSRWELADEKLAVEHNRVVSLEKQKAAMQQTIDRLRRENEAMKAQQVTGTDLANLIRLAETDLAEAEQRRDDAAKRIVANAEIPSTEAFQQAVVDHRDAQASVESKKERLARLNAIMNAE